MLDMCDSTIKFDPFDLGQISPVKRSVSTLLSPTATDRHTLRRTALLAAIPGATDPLPGRAASALFPAGRLAGSGRFGWGLLLPSYSVARCAAGGCSCARGCHRTRDEEKCIFMSEKRRKSVFLCRKKISCWRRGAVQAVPLDSHYFAKSLLCKKTLNATRYLICWQQKMLLGEAWWRACAQPVAGLLQGARPEGALGQGWGGLCWGSQQLASIVKTTVVPQWFFGPRQPLFRLRAQGSGERLQRTRPCH